LGVYNRFADEELQKQRFYSHHNSHNDIADDGNCVLFWLVGEDQKSIEKKSEIKYFTYNPKSLEKIFQRMKTG
jgi:hypothetical protein